MGCVLHPDLPNSVGFFMWETIPCTVQRSQASAGEEILVRTHPRQQRPAPSRDPALVAALLCGLTDGASDGIDADFLLGAGLELKLNDTGGCGE